MALLGAYTRDLLAGCRDICNVIDSPNSGRACHETLGDLDCLRDCENIRDRDGKCWFNYDEIDKIAQAQIQVSDNLTKCEKSVHEGKW